jgi:hypothetical protein
MKASHQRLRRLYRPAETRLLFIGEAPPTSGRFFYRKDSGLYRAIQDAFRMIDLSITDDRFLGIFQKAGCYLIDACAEPVDHLDARSRRAARLASEPSLGRRISRLQPAVIVILLQSIQGNVRRATEHAGWYGEIINLPYPGRWARHREMFLRVLVPELQNRLGSELRRITNCRV